MLKTFKFAVTLFFAVAKAEKCATFCTMDYTPVCAEAADGGEHTYSNRCALDSYNCVQKTSNKQRYSLHEIKFN